MAALSPYQLLEINLISVQDIAKVSRSMKTYAVAWVHPKRKLTTRVDTHGGTNPTWNDKFIFRVDDQFLKSETSAIMIEIYALHWFKDIHVGTVRVLVGNIIPPQVRSHNQTHIGMRFVALQVRRPSGRPQGILNVGVTVLDSTKRSMPLYAHLCSSAVGYQTLMGQAELYSHKPNGTSTNNNGPAMMQLRRTKSEKSSMIGMDECIINFDNNNDFILPKPNKSIINGSDLRSMVGKKNKFVYDKPLSIIDGADAGSNLSLAVKLKAQEGKADSMLGFDTSSTKGGGVRKAYNKTTSKLRGSSIGEIPPLLRKDFNASANKRAASEINVKNETKIKHNWLPPVDSKKPNGNNNKSNNHKGYPIKKDFAAGSVWSESEVGPSPSEVAAAIAEDNKYRQYDDGASSMLYDKWSVDDSEGIRTKLDRWRTEMPPLYDRFSPTTDNSSIFPVKRHNRRHTEGGGKFSCFSNICGLECTIVCGKGGNGGSSNKPKNDANNKRVTRVLSMDSVSTYF